MSFVRDVIATVGELRVAQKPRRGTSLYSAHVNRPLGRLLAAIAHRLRLTPNGVTLISGTFSLAAVVLIASGSQSVAVGVVAAIALVVGFALDSADGQLARLRQSGSRAGEWLDHVLDCLVKISLHGAVLVAWHRSGAGDGQLLLALGFQIAAVLLFFAGTLVALLKLPSSSGPAPASPLRAMLLIPVDHGVICLAFLLWGFQEVFVPLWAVLFAAHALMLLTSAVRWFRELS